MNSFRQCFEYSIGQRELFDEDVLRNAIPYCMSVYKTNADTDRKGVDYIVTLTDGSQITVDAKTRQKGAKRWWKQEEPELALEKYSVVELKKVGWLFKNSAVHPDYILYTFDKSDSDKFYLVPYVLLRKAAYKRWKHWENQYGVKKQLNSNHGGYTSDAIFVPASVLIGAVAHEMVGTVK